MQNLSRGVDAGGVNEGTKSAGDPSTGDPVSEIFTIQGLSVTPQTIPKHISTIMNGMAVKPARTDSTKGAGTPKFP